MRKYLEKATNFNNTIIVIFIGIMERNINSSWQKDLIENGMPWAFPGSGTPPAINMRP
jgi:hypothetical protein